jgi:hypothetical protein
MLNVGSRSTNDVAYMLRERGVCHGVNSIGEQEMT